jgi:hypothetical protein
VIRSVYLAVREQKWNRDRRRRIAVMLERERTAAAAKIDWAEEMALQLAEIRALPEAPEPQRSGRLRRMARTLRALGLRLSRPAAYVERRLVDAYQ